MEFSPFPAVEEESPNQRIMSGFEGYKIPAEYKSEFTPDEVNEM